jgi:hypothetical protein
MSKTAELLVEAAREDVELKKMLKEMLKTQRILAKFDIN